MGRGYSIGVWSHFELLDWTEHSTAFRPEATWKNPKTGRDRCLVAQVLASE